MSRFLGVGAAATVIAGFGMALLTGCAGQSEVSLLDPLSHRGATPASAWHEVLARRLNRPHDDMQALAAQHAAATDATEQRRCRDGFAFAALSLIEEHAQRGRIRLATARAAHDAAGDLAMIGLGTAAAFTGGEALTSALAASAAAVAGANRAIDARFLSEQTTAAIIAQMDVNHRTAQQAIVRRLRQSDDSEYPLAAVKLDLLACLYAGTVTNAVAALADEAALRRAALRSSNLETGSQ